MNDNPYRVMRNSILWVVVWLCGSAASGQDGYVLSTDLLPNTTQGFVAVDDLSELEAAWQRTNLGKLFETPEMRPIEKSVGESIDNWLSQHGGNLSIRLGELRKITSGQLVVVWMSSEELRHPYRVCLLADTRGEDEASLKAMAQAESDLKKRGAQIKEETVDGQVIKTFTLPTKPGHLDFDQMAYTRFEGRLIIGDRADIVKEMLVAARQGQSKGLIESDDYKAVQKEIGAAKSHVRWFVRPMGMARIVRDILRQGEIRREDVIGMLEQQGFDALKSAGGAIELGNPEHDALQQMFIHAPPTGEAPDRYRLAARMLNFPNAPVWEIPKWVNLDIASAFRMNWEMEKAFWASETLVNAIINDDVFQDLLNNIREDPEGSQIDLPKEVIANLNNRMLMVTDNTQPSTLNSERLLVAIPLKNAAAVARAVQKQMEFEVDFVLVEHPDQAKYPIWESRPAEDESDEELQKLGLAPAPSRDENEKPEALLETWALTVYKDHLMFASHTQLLLDLLKADRDVSSSGREQEKHVLEAMQKLHGTEEFSMFRVIFPELAWRVKYDLLRSGQLRDSDSVLASLVRRAVDEFEKANLKVAKTPEERLRIKGEELPKFEFVKPYLHPIGTAVHTTESGWRITNIILAK